MPDKTVLRGFDMMHAKEMPTGDMAFKEIVLTVLRRDCACHKKCLTTVNNYDLLTLLHGEGLSQLRYTQKKGSARRHFRRR
jgi:hypothetical protein